MVERGWRPKQWFWPGPARWSSASVWRSAPSPNGRTGHWDWLRYRIGKNLPVTIVHDEYRSVVWAHDLALRVMRMAESGETGIRHVSATRVISRIELANHLLTLFGEPASYESESRHQRSAPHLGRVELASIHSGELYEPLQCVLDGPNVVGRYCD